MYYIVKAEKAAKRSKKRVPTAVLVAQVTAVVFVVAHELFPHAELVRALKLAVEATVKMEACMKKRTPAKIDGFFVPP